VAAIYEVKGRPSFNPLIVHVAEKTQLDSLIEWSDVARALADKFWPGPLTLVLPRKRTANVALLVSAGLESLAVRIPSHPVAQKLLRAVNLPIAAPSANASGRLSPTSAQHVAESLGKKVDLILDGGRSAVGVESTVVSLLAPEPTILRPGGVTREDLSDALGRSVAVYGAKTPDAPASPGMLSSHYAPRLPVRLNAKEPGGEEAFIGFGPNVPPKGALILNLSQAGDLREAAANLFALLREADKPSFKGIAIAPIPDKGLGLAINDRLRRAAIR
jgi:L-threonylcarbamoyladenylate synthase